MKVNLNYLSGGLWALGGWDSAGYITNFPLTGKNALFAPFAFGIWVGLLCDREDTLYVLLLLSLLLTFTKMDKHKSLGIHFFALYF